MYACIFVISMPWGMQLKAFERFIRTAPTNELWYKDFFQFILANAWFVISDIWYAEINSERKKIHKRGGIAILGELFVVDETFRRDFPNNKFHIKLKLLKYWVTYDKRDFSYPFWENLLKKSKSSV